MYKKYLNIFFVIVLLVPYQEVYSVVKQVPPNCLKVDVNNNCPSRINMPVDSIDYKKLKPHPMVK